MKVVTKKTYTYDLFKDGLTQSVITSWLKCKEKMRLGVVEGWTSIKSGSTFIFGELAHAILEQVYSTPEFRKAPPDQYQITKMVNRHIYLWKKEHEGFIDAYQEENLELAATKLIAVLPHYFKFWHKKDFGETKWIALEKEFVMNVGGVPIRGKRDGEYRIGKDIYLFETKTKGQIDENSLYEVLQIDFQTLLYSLSLFKEHGQWPKGTRYNIIRNPGNRIKKNESLKAFGKRIEDEVIKRPEHYFKRMMISRTTSELEGFRNELKQIIADITAWYLHQSPHYKNPNACSDKYGTCSLIRICAMGKFNLHKKRNKVFTELSYTQEV